MMKVYKEEDICVHICGSVMVQHVSSYYICSPSVRVRFPNAPAKFYEMNR